jgi:hypothetical protein
VGQAGSIEHWDGWTWTRFDGVTTSDLTAVWALASSDVWAVGHGGTILHWDGNQWSQVESGTDADILDLQGFPATSERSSELWAVGRNGTILRRVDEEWSAITPRPDGSFVITPEISFSEVIADRNWGVFALGSLTTEDPGIPLVGKIFQWDMSKNVPQMYDVPIDQACSTTKLAHPASMWGAGYVWVAIHCHDRFDLPATDGLIVPWNGMSASIDNKYCPDFARRATGLWSLGAENVWAVADDGTLAHFSGSGWMECGKWGNGALRAIWGSQIGLWVVGDGRFKMQVRLSH